MLLAILMPALGKVKKLAMRLVCGTNAKGLGTAMNVYAFDYNDEFPRKSATRVWDESTGGVYGLSPDFTNTAGVTVAASLYMLVREADVGPKSFICPSSNEVEFRLSDHADTTTGELEGTAATINDTELTDIHDFGFFPTGGWNGDEGNGSHNSYSYQQPYKIGTGATARRAYPTDASGNAARAILADKTPYGDPDLKFTTAAADTLGDNWKEYVGRIDYTQSSSTDFRVQIGNSALHDREGQNILFNDGHAEFARRPDVSINNDNIYVRAGAAGTEVTRRNGQRIDVMQTDGWASGGQDTLLVHDSDAPTAP
jgi:hypothetical protein